MHKLIAASFLVLLVFVGCLLGCTSKKAVAPPITLTALGPTTNAGGRIQFLVAITNNTLFPVDCCVGRQRTTNLVVGSVSQPTTNHLTNYMYPGKLAVPAKSGRLIAVDPPEQPGPWVLGGYFKRFIGKPEEQARNLAANARLLEGTNVYPNWEAITTVNVEK